MRRPLIAPIIALSLSGLAIADPPKSVVPATRPAPLVAPRTANVPLDDFFEQLRGAGLNLQVNWPALEAVGVDRAAPVNLQMKGVNIRTLLTYALRQVGSDTLAWYVDGSVVYVTTRQLSDRQMVTKVFPVGDLLVDVPDFETPQVNLSSGGGGTGGSGGGGSQGMFGGGNSNSNSNQTQRSTKAERGEKLAELIRSTIRPEVWVENGGPASIRFYGDNLIVTAPRDVLDKIGK